jgi:hypothetical protein
MVVATFFTLSAYVVQKIALTAIVDQTDNCSTRAGPRPSRRAANGGRITPMLREMIHFLVQMPSDTKIFLAVAVLGLAGALMVLKWLM